MPRLVKFKDQSTITYTYAADGTKLRVEHKIGNSTTRTTYCSNVIYEDGTAKCLLTEEGYVSLDDREYHYYLKDHQGNNRVLVNKNGGVEEINHYYPFGGVFASEENVIISNTGYTGAGGFELYFYPSAADSIWKAIFEAGEEYGIKPIGLGARDTLRLEMGFCLYGNDLDDTTSPIEAGLGWITKFAEGKNFTNRAELERQKKEGVSRKLCAFELVDKGIPRHGYEIADAEGNIIGVVTSGTMSPVLKKGIGMGYVKPEFAKAGTEICIKVRGRNLKAQVVKAPFRK